MTSSGKNVRTYPVWVGNLNESVNEAILRESFGLYGTVVSVRVMGDENKRSKGFAFVNFASFNEAEGAAQIMDNRTLYGNIIKAKGPSVLKREGHWNTDPPPASSDFRPVTDCAFFMDGAKCKKGSRCPYRHSELARGSSVVCPGWLDKKCLKVDCPHKHPGGREKGSKRAGKDPAVFVATSPSQTFLKCGGKCGDTRCSALFLSEEDLSKHVEAAKPPTTAGLPQCVQCRAIFPSHGAYQEHLQTCWARASVTSTDHSSDSPEVEELSDTDTGEYYDLDAFSSSSSLKGKGPKTVSPHKKERGGKKFPNGQARHRTTSGSSSDGHFVSNSNSHGSQYVGVKAGGMDTAKYDPSAFDNSTDSYFSLYTDGDGDVESDSDSDSDDEPVEYTMGEMARLLSLNEQDMRDSSDSSDEDAIPFQANLQNSGGTHNTEGAVPQGPLGKEDRAASVGGGSSSSGGGSKQWTATHKVKLEPVGVFWDIENCPVPVDKSAFGVAAKMRSEFISGKREAEFMCVCDITKERKEVTDELHKAQVTLVHVNAIAKNAADDKLRHSLRRFAHTYPSPATVVLISGDVNFSMELNDLMHLHNLEVVLVHNEQASSALKAFATKLVAYEAFIADVEPPSRQAPDQHRIVVVSGLPKNMHFSKISSRLDRISDNCGGKVLRVDTNAGTARVLFRTNEWAKKALKRMDGEDVYGHKISTSLETPPPSSQQQQGMGHLVGANLAKTFPPPPQRQPLMGGIRTPPLPHPMYRPGPPPPSSNMGPPFNAMRPHYPMPPQPRGVLPPPPLMQGQIRPPGPMGHPRLPPPPSTLPPMPPQLPRFPRPPMGNPKNLPNGSLPRPEGRILIFKIPPHEEPALRHNMDLLQGNSFISAETMLLWHGYLELQVVLRLDFMQTAVIRKEEIVHTLYERGELGPETASKFVETCTKSVSDVLRRCNLPWEVTTCGWSSEEEENRVIRSNVIALLRKNPTCWTKFSNFKKKYFETYESAISEMAVHSSCAGAVQILSDYATSASEIIIFYEFSPLLKIENNARLHAKLRSDFEKFLKMQPEKKIRLLDFVDSYLRSKIGPLPPSSSGKMLQEIITSVPNVTLVGSKPSNIFVTLSAPSNRGTGNGTGGGTQPKAVFPHNLVGISAAFCHLLRESGGPNGIPYKRFQQQYQTFFHRSFRVADYLSGDKGVRDLINVCQGVKIVTLTSGGKKEDWVCLDDPSSVPPTSLPTTIATPSSNIANTTSPLSAAAAAVSKVPLGGNRSGHTLSPPPPSPGPSPNVGPTTPSTPAAAAVRRPSSSASNRSEGNKLRPVETIAVEFRELLSKSPNNQLPLKIFQQSYQTYFHHPFRISTYLSPATAGMKDLLHECQGIQLKSLQLPNGKWEEYVCLESGSKKASPTEPQPLPKPSSTSSLEGAANYLMPDLIEKFRQDCIEVLTTLEGHSVPMVQFPEHFMKVKKEQFLLVNYKAKKMMHLLEAIPEVVQVKTSGDIKIIKLCPIDPKKTCEKEVEVLVYEQPNHTITLDRFMLAYQSKYSRRLHFYGHPKLLKLLEEFSNTIEVTGNGPSRPIRLLPPRIFACQMTELLFPQSDPMPISKIVPAFSDKFKRDLNISQYGFPKLIKALEELTDLIVIRGAGAARTVKLKSLPHYTSLFASLSPSAGRAPPASPSSASGGGGGAVGWPSTLPSPQHLTDEVTAVLMSTHSLKMSLIELTKGYNQAFRGPLAKQKGKVQNGELLQVLQNLPNFKITGAGTPTCYVQIAQSSNVITPPVSTKTTKVSGDASPPAPVRATPTPVQAELGKDPEGGSGGISNPVSTEQPTKRKLFDDPLLPETSASSTSSSPVPQSPRSTGGVGQVQRSPSGPVTEEDENHRLCSETRRMLLTHQEHAMTLTELAECFARGGDPATPTAEKLYAVLKKATGTGADKSPTQKKFEISHFPSDVGASLVQLNRADCLWKLGEDLLNLFVYNPTADMTLAVSDLETLYAECYSRKLVTAVYAAKDIKQVLRSKQLKKVIHVNDSKCFPCSPCDAQVLVSLLTELLFCRGKDCVSLDSLPRLYQDHFKVPLPLDHFKVKDPGSLLKLPRVSELISLDAYSKPVLKPITLFTEQIRHLLTKFNGRIVKDQLELIYTKEFGTPVSPEVKKYLRKRLPHEAFFVANLANHRWLVWAPTGHPRHQRSQSRDAESALPIGCNEDEGGNSFLKQPDPADDLPQGEVGFSGHAHYEGAEKESEPFFPGYNVHLLHSEMEGVKPFSTDSSCIVDLSTIPLTSKPSAGPKENGKLDPIFTPSTELELTSTPSTKPELDSVENPHSVPLSTSKLEDVPSTLLKPHPILVHEEEKGNSGSSQQQVQDESPYDFLKNHPEILEELSKPSHYEGIDCSIPVDDLKIITEVLAVQRLQELGFGASKSSTANSSSSARPPSFSNSSPLLSSATGSDGAPAVPVPTSPKPRGARPPLPPNPTAADFLESDLSPDEVLAQLQQLKERCGGVLRPDQMSPFLDYFGELSSRELDRIDALEGKKPKKSGGGGRTKRNMAIRFPSQQPSAASSAAASAAATDHPELDFSRLEISGKLPVADFGDISDSSNDEEVVPINRNEYIRRFLEGGDPDNNISNKEDLSVLHSKDDAVPGVEGSGRSDDLPRPLLPPSQSGANTSTYFEDILDASKINF